jgi:hypothetical protein
MDRIRLPKLVFSINHGDDRVLEDPKKCGKIQNTLSFEGRGVETSPLFIFTKKNTHFPSHTQL